MVNAVAKLMYYPWAGTFFIPVGAVIWAHIKKQRYDTMLIIPIAIASYPTLKYRIVVIYTISKTATAGPNHE